MFEMTNFTPTTGPGKGGTKPDDAYNGVISITDKIFGTAFDIVKDPTPPAAVRTMLIQNRSRGGTDRDHPFWNYAYPAASFEARPGELRYPELFGDATMTYVRVQIHETAASLSAIRNLYHPGPWAPRLNDGGLDPDHQDDGPSLEDCVGRQYYKQMGLTPRKYP